jgi:hypothetical protein
VTQCTGQVRDGRVYGYHVVCGRDGAGCLQEVFEPASSTLDGWQVARFSFGCGNSFQMSPQDVEFTINISADLQADPIGIVDGQMAGEL